MSGNFRRGSRIFKGWGEVYLKEGRIAWDLDLILGSYFPHPVSPHAVVGMVISLVLTHADMVQCIYDCPIKVVNYDEVKI